LKKNLKGIGFYAGVLVVLIIILAFMYDQNENEGMSYYKMTQLFKQEQVVSFVLDGNMLAMDLKDGSKVEKMLPSRDIFLFDLYDLIKEQSEKGIIQDYDLPPPPEVPWWVSMMPYVVLIVIFILLWMYLINQTGGGGGKVMSFGRAKTKTLSESQKKVTFKDVAGADEEKEELKEVVDFLRDPTKFVALGARIPTGILMVGPPGTGKTLLAKAVAGESGVPFFSISGSDFVEMFVGVGASRVRDLFDQAKKSSPCIIFIDEIDAVGRHRGAGLGGGHDEREQTLNQLLVEMDGFGVNEGIIIIAATNRPDILDPALLRPGRFDRQVYVTTPDIKGREGILKVHSRGKPLAEDVNLATIAKTTSGFTGADLENLLNEAALLSARRNKKTIGMQEIEEATIKVVVGPEKKSRVISDKEKKLTAYHEAGHAIATYAHPERDPVHQISIIPRGRAGGFTLSLPKEDRYYMSQKDMLEEIVVLLGGRTAEKMVLDDISTGASNDLERASAIARKMVMRYGMSEKLGPIVFGQPNEEIFLGRDFNTARNYSETVAAIIDEEVKKIIDNAYEQCRELLEHYLDKLHTVAQGLFQEEKLSGEQFARIMAGEEINTVLSVGEQDKETTTPIGEDTVFAPPIEAAGQSVEGEEE
jgi:cell division protease FtsH